MIASHGTTHALLTLTTKSVAKEFISAKVMNTNPFNRLQVFRLHKDRHASFAVFLRVLIPLWAIVCIGADATLAQQSVAEFHRVLREKAAFDETNLAALEQGETVVGALPGKDKREVAVCGLVGVQVPAHVFLQSFRENMVRKSNPAILEIGKFSSAPTLDDLQSLTIENRDIDDLKECVVGNCKLKLSASMIQRFHQEMDWEAPDYRMRATQLLKGMLLDYVRDYQARGDAALIEYSDKPKEVRLAEEQRTLMAASGYLGTVLPDFPQNLKSFAKSDVSVVEDAIVWSKLKFGLKPVIAINHITVYRRERESGPQVLVASKQIYANHYFNSSLALTAFVNIPGSSSGSYLVYENRSRADGLEGPFGKIKRGIVEGKAVNGLKTILESSKVNLNARPFNQTQSALPSDEGRKGSRWKISKVHVFLLFLVTAFSGFSAWFALGTYNWKRGISGGAGR
jgi:hypothetical protein